jgi:hypothetical protein
MLERDSIARLRLVQGRLEVTARCDTNHVSVGDDVCRVDRSVWQFRRFDAARDGHTGMVQRGRTVDAAGQSV